LRTSQQLLCLYVGLRQAERGQSVPFSYWEELTDGQESRAVRVQSPEAEGLQLGPAPRHQSDDVVREKTTRWTKKRCCFFLKKQVFFQTMLRRRWSFERNGHERHFSRANMRKSPNHQQLVKSFKIEPANPKLYCR